jgi:hypothetical protein
MAMPTRSPRVTPEPASAEPFNPSTTLREYVAGSGFVGQDDEPEDCPPEVAQSGIALARAALAASRSTSSRTEP